MVGQGAHIVIRQSYESSGQTRPTNLVNSLISESSTLSSSSQFSSFFSSSFYSSSPEDDSEGFGCYSLRGGLSVQGYYFSGYFGCFSSTTYVFYSVLTYLTSSILTYYDFVYSFTFLPFTYLFSMGSFKNRTFYLSIVC